MLKTFRSVLILCLTAVFASFIALEALGFQPSGKNGEGASASVTETGQDAAMPSAADEARGETIGFISEPEAQEIVTVIVGTKSAPLIEIANERGVSVSELYAGFDGEKLLAERNAEIGGAIRSLGGLLLETGYRYTGVFNGFSARVRYGDIARIEKNDAVRCVILSNTYESPQAITENDVNVQDTGIFNSEDAGYDGTGTVVAVLDTGTDYTHEVFDMVLDPNTMAITKDDVAASVPLLAATAMSAALDSSAEIDEDNLYISSKLPYGFDYADVDTDVYPAEAHGTHVAGIIGGESWKIRGVAPRAQIATFKVFQDTGNSSTEGILAALNDAVVLGVDAINMSLGATCGFSREEDEPYVNEVYDYVEDSGVSLIVAAGNEYSSSYGGAHGNTNLSSNPDSGTVGSPASYYASLAVASISGIKTPYVYANGEKEIYFRESRTTGQTKPNNFVNELLGDKESGEYEYVVIPGVGYDANYIGIDVEGKIAVVKRGSNSFEDKVKIARSRGAVAVIVYNNLSGMLNMSIGTVNLLPSCLVSMDYGKYLESKPQGTIRVQKDYLAGPFMSDFSSWGPLPNLELTPDITGHGGDITSSFPGGNEYDTISGTSMACPNIAGAVVLVREYVKNMAGMRSTEEVRDLTYNLMMSTATIARNEDGNPYSPRKQGAGIGDIKRSVTTKAYLSVEGSNKAKLSLKDDPSRSGVYEMTFNVTNLSGDALSYKINPIVMTESMSSDEKTVAEMAYMLNPASSFSVKAITGEAVVEGTTLNLGGYAEAQLTVTVRLSGADKDYLNRNFANGMYVEGYIELQSYNEDGINLNIPYLAFYGNWEDAPMLDVTAYEVGESAVDSSVLAEDKLVADVYGTLPMAGFDTQDDYGNTEIASWGLGAFGYNAAQGYTLPVTRERYASLTHSTEGNYMLYSIAAGLLRNAKRVKMEIRDSVTGELIWEHTDYNARKSHSNGGEQAGGYLQVNFDVRNYDLANNGKYTFSMECFLDWMKEGDEDYSRGNRNTFSFEFYIDDEAPVLLKDRIYVRDDRDNHRKTVEFNVYDNHYLQGYIAYTYKSLDANGNPTGLTSLTDGVVPIYDGEFNGTTRVSLDVTSRWSTIEENGGKIYVQFMDYAKNYEQSFITLKECEDVRLDKTRSARDEYTIRPNGQIDLSDYIRIYSKVDDDYFEDYWTKDLVWVSDTPEVAEVREGLVTGLTKGDAVIEVRPDPAGSFEPLTFTIHVDGEPDVISVSGIELSEYSLSLERGESRTISATVKPYNYGGSYSIIWSSTSANVRVEPDKNDQTRCVVTAVRSGSATVSARIDGVHINASCSVRVQNEYYVDSVYLRSYTGRGDENGVVEIPDDLGIAYIYPMAFYNNPYIKKIIIPEGVLYVMRAGIYGCDNLEEIVLPESCTQLQTFSVAWNPKLKKINMDHVQTIGSRAFIYDTALEEIDLSRVTYISDMAFTNCTALKSVDLSKVGTVGPQAFQGCSSLTELVLPANTTTATAAFYQCTGLKRVTAYNSHIGPLTFQGCTALTDVTFVGDVDLIDVQAFYGCTSLKNVNFLGSVYEIGALAFAADYSLTSFRLPAGLTKIGQQVLANTRVTTIEIDKDACVFESDVAAYVGLSSLREFKVEAGNKYLSSENGVLYDKTMYRLVAYPYARSATLFTVPASVRVIGPNAFTAVSCVDEINLNNVERAEEHSFRQCTAVISGGEKLAYIGAYAFAASVSSRATDVSSGSTSFTPGTGSPSVSSGESSGSTGSTSSSSTSTTEATSNLKSLPIAHATYIGDYAFANCINLTQTRLEISDAVTYVGEFAFYNCPISEVVIGNGIGTIGYGAFSHCTQLTTVNFGDTLTAISPEMFAECTSLREITIPSGIKTIGAYAFYGARTLQTVNLPDALTEIPEYCFYGTNISAITVPASVTKVGAHAFESANISGFNFANIEEVGASAFENTKLGGVQSLTLETVGARAFYESSVEQVSLPAAKTIGESAFARCASLTNAELPAAETLGTSAFESCTSLATVNVSKAETIGPAAFRGATRLNSVTLTAARTVGANAFAGTGITGLSLPNLETAELQAFAGATKLTAISVGEYNNRYTSEDGVLYRKNSGNFFTLVAYPLGKTATTYTVKERTVKIGAYAFAENTVLTKIVLPVHLKSIGTAAFYHAEALTEVEVGAVAAPTLESVGVMDGEIIVNTYNNFKEEYGNTFTMTWTVPKNATGYDSYIWQQYLGENIRYTDQDAIGSAALDFIDRVDALSTLPGEDRAAEIALLLRIYSLFDATQKQFVAEAYAKLQQAAGGASYLDVTAAQAETAGTDAANGGTAWIAAFAAAVAAGGALFLAMRAHSGRREK